MDTLLVVLFVFLSVDVLLGYALMMFIDLSSQEHNKAERLLTLTVWAAPVTFMVIIVVYAIQLVMQ